VSTPDHLSRALVAEAERCYPKEACGLIFEGPKGARVVPMENVIDRYHERDPQRFPRTGATGYLIDPLRQLAALEAAERDGERLISVFHSHVEVGAYFSEEDRAMALTDGGAPLLPGVSYLVLSVRRGRCDDLREFRLADGRFEETVLALPAPNR
jgi:[CysO sulfur-carrier protein]-S-L-cysteine hydrolase